jgi:hypothetical protein
MQPHRRTALRCECKLVLCHSERPPGSDTCAVRQCGENLVFSIITLENEVLRRRKAAHQNDTSEMILHTDPGNFCHGRPAQPNTPQGVIKLKEPGLQVRLFQFFCFA